MKKSLILILVFMLVPVYVEPSSALTGLQPSLLSIEGNIVDNFANITYGMVFNNEDSTTDSQVIYRLGKPEGLFLSNISAIMGNMTFWGKVNEIEEAKQKYNASVEANKSAVLVSLENDFYNLELNVQAGKILFLKVYFEGYLTRKLGIYELELFKKIETKTILDFSININVTSSLSTIQKLRVLGVSGSAGYSITNGKQIVFSQSNYEFISDINLQYTLSQLDIGGKLLTYTNGTDKFFVYLLAPEIQNVVERESREFIFVIDISGSMGSDNRLNQAKEAFSNMIETLDNDDLFNIITFESNIDVLWEEPRTANLDYINEAVNWVNNLSPKASTNLNDGVIKGVESFIGDKTVKVVTVLSDGVPTSGVQDHELIRENIKQANTHEAMIFSIAFGSATAEGLMASIAYDSGGQFTVIQPGENSVEKLGVFYEQFATPIALSYSISYTNTISNSVFPIPSSLKGALFNGSEILQTGIYIDQLVISTSIEFSDDKKIYTNQADAADTSSPHIERIWAHNTINQLLKVVKVNGETPELKQQIISLALHYGIVVPKYTALIILIEDKTEISEDPSEEGDSKAQGISDGTNYPDVQVVTSVDYVQQTAEQIKADSEGLAIPGFLWNSMAISLVLFVFTLKKRSK